MPLTVVVRPSLVGGFVARSGDPIPCEAHGDTRDEALQNLRELLDAERARGVEILEIDFSKERQLK